MKKIVFILFFACIIFTACGGGTKPTQSKHKRVFIDTTFSNGWYIVESEGTQVGFLRRINVRQINDKYNDTLSVAVPDTFKVVPGQIIKISIIEFYSGSGQLNPSWMVQIRKE